MKKADLYFNAIRLPVDFLMLWGAGIATYFLRTKILSVFRPVFFELNLPFFRYFSLVVIVSILFILFYAASGLYSMRRRLTPTEEFTKIFVASLAGIMIVIMYIFLRQELFNSRFLVVGAWFLAVTFVFLGRLTVRSVQRHSVAKYDFWHHRLLVIGDDETTQKITTAIEKDPGLGYRIVKQLTNPEISEIANVIDNPGVDEVILANPNYPGEKIVELIDFCNENHIIFKYVPNVHQILTRNFEVDVMYNTPVIELKRTGLDGWGKVVKRIIDITFSLSALILLSPLFILIALLIRWDTQGPIFVRLVRVSKNRTFPLLKFRSMVANAEELKQELIQFNERNDGPLFKMRNDPRITRVGKVLRHFRLDELPQFFNILMGDISLVGPRPHQPDEISKYEKHHKKVLAIKAGATGLAQISGSSDLPFEEEVIFDTSYIENWSLVLDLKIILKTAGKILTDRSAV